MWLLYLPLVIPALAGAAARLVAARLEPRQATWLLTCGAVALAGCSTAALALLAAFAAARTPALAALGDYSQQVMQRADPISAAAGAAAALALIAAAAAVAVMFRNRARALAESYRRAARLDADDGIVVVPGPAIEAYALPGWPGRIVVSGCLLDRLDNGSRAALIAHEQAHLAGRHHLFAAAARLAAAANPLLLPVARAVEYTVERWADEHAAAVTGDRRLVAETIGRVALLASPGRPRLWCSRKTLTRPPAACRDHAGHLRAAYPAGVGGLGRAGAPPRRRPADSAAAAADPPARRLRRDRPARRGSRPGSGQGPARPARTRPGLRVAAEVAPAAGRW